MKMLKRKEFDALFSTFKASDTQIHVIIRVKELPRDIVQIALDLAALDFIKYIRITDDLVEASSENYPKRPKVPIVRSNHNTATGIEILYSTALRLIDFNDINSIVKGYGSKMVDAVFKSLPTYWQPSVLMDWSDGFWDKMKERYKKYDWLE